EAQVKWPASVRPPLPSFSGTVSHQSVLVQVLARWRSFGAGTAGAGPAPKMPLELLAHALDEEGDAHQGAPLVEVLAAEAGRDHVDRLDVAERLPGVVQRRL